MGEKAWTSAAAQIGNRNKGIVNESGADTDIVAQAVIFVAKACADPLGYLEPQ